MFYKFWKKETNISFIDQIKVKRSSRNDSSQSHFKSKMARLKFFARLIHLTNFKIYNKKKKKMD